MLRESLQSGKALTYFRKMIKAQGGDEQVINDYDRLPQAKYTYELYARETGYLTAFHTEQIGVAAMMLGAGRETVDSIIDLSVGIVLHKKIGDHVTKGESLLTIYANNPMIEPIQQKLLDAITLTKQMDELSYKQSLIYDIIT
ncbi:MAG TPA: pyrimidine-nucleoside phosphorylase, partial [Bacillota bacterium]|nr:pyrimidine-nucleoside phosphorylase [Bacillota bacterium]